MRSIASVQDALCAAVQIAQELQNSHTLTSLLADNAPSEDFWSAVDLIAELYFDSCHGAPAIRSQEVPQTAFDTLLRQRVGRRPDAVAKAALLLGFAWTLVNRRTVAQVQPVH